MSDVIDSEDTYDEALDKRLANMRRPKFRVFKDASGEWRFTLVGGNGEPMMQSEAYTRRSDAVRGVEAVVEAARIAVVEAR